MTRSQAPRRWAKAPRRWAKALWHGLLATGLLWALGASVLPLATAAPDAELLTDSKRAQMIEEIVNGNTARRRGHLAALKALPDGVEGREYGNVLGPILREPRYLEGKEPAEASQILFDLIEDLILHQPTSARADVILLDGLILQRLALAPELVQRLRENLPLIDGRQADWDRLLTHAGRRLGDADASVRRAAIRAMSWYDPGRLSDALAQIYGAVSSAPADRAREDGAAYVDALASLLGFRFDRLEDAVAFLRPFGPRFERRPQWAPIERESLRADLERAGKSHVLARGQREAERQRAIALDLGRQLVARAQGPDALLALLDPAKDYPPELYREALRHARTKLKPEPARPWADLIVAALKRTQDGEALGELTELLAGSFTQPSEVSDGVADAVALRLKEGVLRDAIAQRIRLAEILDRVARTPLQVRQALPDRVDLDDSQREVWVRLIKALGGRSGAVTEILLPYYRAPGGQATQVAYRRAVAEAMARDEGLDPAERGHVAHALRFLLTGDAAGSELTARFGQRESDPDVRAALLLALAEYPTAESVAVLARLAENQDVEAEKEARMALEILGRMWQVRSDVAAGRALMGLSAMDSRRRSTLEWLKRVPRELEPAHCESVCAPIRAMLDSPISSDEKGLAADVMIALRDLSAFPGIYRLWSAAEGEARQAWGVRIAQWASGVASRTAIDGDGVLGQALDLLAAEGHLDVALGALKSLTDASLQRPAVQALRIRLLFAGANDAARDVVDRRRMADEALRLITPYAPQAKGEDALRVRAMQFGLNQLRAGDLKGAEEAARAFYVEACRAAADARDANLAQRGLDLLAQMEARNGLSDEEKAEIKGLRQRLEEARAANGGG